MRAAGLASVSVAAVLIALKVWAWLTTDSVALLSSLADSLLDLLASMITFFALSFAVTPPDREHRFGHGKSEGIAGLVQALIVSGSAVYVAFAAVQRLLRPQPLEQIEVGVGVMLVSLALTISLITFQRRVVARTGSIAVSADSVHYRADVLTNVGILAGILAADLLSWHIADPLIGLAVAGVILVSVKQIAFDSLNVLLDRELPGKVRKRIEHIATAHPAVLGVHDIRTRSAGSMQFIQLHLELDPGLTLLEVHEISDAVEIEMHKAFPLAEVLIHADPYGLKEPRDSF
ncbi:MAG: cation diffusion facilitator family transporter [Gammaproteobacteria bacterium]|nr:cation diffusion facilitator family transporter [Gammaproteobacteria bacterium]